MGIMPHGEFTTDFDGNLIGQSINAYGINEHVYLHCSVTVGNNTVLVGSDQTNLCVNRWMIRGSRFGLSAL